LLARSDRVDARARWRRLNLLAQQRFDAVITTCGLPDGLFLELAAPHGRAAAPRALHRD
jgi:hypothetical protein